MGSLSVRGTPSPALARGTPSPVLVLDKLSLVLARVGLLSQHPAAQPGWRPGSALNWPHHN